jgi:hypothetical protein
MTVETQVSIKATPATVWDTITNIKKTSEIIRGIEKIEIVDEPVNGLAGLKWRETRMYFGKPATVEKWITEAVQNKCYKTRSEMDGFIFETTMSMVETAEGVRLISSHQSRPLGFAAKIKSIPMVFFKGMLKKALDADLEDFRIAAEKTILGT